MVERKSIIVDIDGTLCPIKEGGENYRDLVPYEPMLDRLKSYQNEGFEIILFTARNMRTHEEKLGKINKHTAPVLIKWLEEWDVPYDQILFGKPWPGSEGYYIDDRSVRPDEFMTLTHEELTQLIEDARHRTHELAKKAT